MSVIVKMARIITEVTCEKEKFLFTLLIIRLSHFGKYVYIGEYLKHIVGHFLLTDGQNTIKTHIRNSEMVVMVPET